MYEEGGNTNETQAVIPTMDQAHEVAMRVLDQLHVAGDLRMAVGEDEVGYAKRAAQAYVAAFREALAA